MPNNVYLYLGNDEYLVGLNARKKVDELCPESEQALSLEVIDGVATTIDDAVAVLGRSQAALRTVGLFGGLKVVWLQNVTFMKNAVIMKNEQVRELMGALTADIRSGLAPEQMLIISAPGIDRRSAFFKAAKESAQVEEYDIPERDYEARPVALRRAIELFKREGYTIDAAAAEIFIDRIGYETRQLMNEAEKMILYKGDDRQVSVEDVQSITSISAEAVAWDFTDAVAERKLGESIRLFRQLLFQKQNAIGLTIQLENLFNHLLRFREFMDAGWLRLNGNRVQWSQDPEVEACLSEWADDPRKMHWFRAGKLAHQAGAYSARHLAAAKRIVVETHERMLSEGSIPNDLLFETLLARLCKPARRRKA